jgi:hypothetical protein
MPRKAAPRRAPAPSKSFGPFQARQVGLGDRIRVERRFVVDGQLTSVADKGVFHGIQAMGSVEHLLLEAGGEVRLIPIPSISEIVLETARSANAGARGTGPAAFDPGFA